MPPCVCMARSHGEERGLGGEVLRVLRRLTARQAVVVAPRRLADDEFGGVQLHVGLGQRERDALVLADRPAEDDAVLGVCDRLVHRHPADAERLGADQDALRVEPVEQVPEALALLADAVG